MPRTTEPTDHIERGVWTPADPVAFVAAAEHATNHCDPDWPMSVYAPDVCLEMIGDGVYQRHQGTAAVRPALRATYEWFAATKVNVTKSLVAATDDTIVLRWEGTLLNGRKTTYGSEIHRFNRDGKVVHNVLYTSLNPKPPTNVIGALRMFVGHPRLMLTFVGVQLRNGREGLAVLTGRVPRA